LRLLPAPGKVRDALEELVLTAQDRAQREVFLASLPKTERTPHGRLRRAFEETYVWIDDYLTAHALTRDAALVTLLQTITQCLIVIDVQVKDEDKAFDVFERLNARGVPLGQADLVKNLLLNYATQARKHVVVKQEWDKFSQQVEATARVISGTDSGWLTQSDFLQIIYASTWNDIKSSDILSPYRALLRGDPATGTPAVAVDVLVRYLRTQAELLHEIVVAPHSWGQGQVRMTLLLRLYLSNKFSLTLALALRSRFQGNSGDFLWGMTLTNSYVFRSFVLGRRQLSRYSADIAAYARRVRWGGGSQHPPGVSPASKPIRGLATLASDMSRELTDAQLIADLLKYRPGSEKLGFYVAYMLEVGAARKSTKTGKAFGSKHPDLQSRATHLEHILPKNASKASGWVHLGLKPDETKSVAAMWGNLLVLPAGVNSSIKDKDIAVKIKAYNGSKCAGLYLPRLVVVAPGTNWDESAIRQHETLLATDFATFAWPFPKSAAHVKSL
jgi:hypothetical protein